MTGAPRGTVNEGLAAQSVNVTPSIANGAPPPPGNRQVGATGALEDDLGGQARIGGKAPQGRARRGGIALRLEDQHRPVGLPGRRAEIAAAQHEARARPRLARHVEHQFEARAGADRHEIVQGLERLARLAVDGDDEGFCALDRQRHHSDGRGVGEAEPHPRARRGRQRQRRGAPLAARTEPMRPAPRSSAASPRSAIAPLESSRQSERMTMASRSTAGGDGSSTTTGPNRPWVSCEADAAPACGK